MCLHYPMALMAECGEWSGEKREGRAMDTRDNAAAKLRLNRKTAARKPKCDKAPLHI